MREEIERRVFVAFVTGFGPGVAGIRVAARPDPAGDELQDGGQACTFDLVHTHIYIYIFIYTDMHTHIHVDICIYVYTYRR